MEDLKDKKIGLVLSGGGAKGAYQVGMFRAFEELGIAPQICAMSGCSIGAYAELIYAVDGIDAYRDYLYDFPGLIAEGDSLTNEQIEQAKLSVKAGAVSKTAFAEDRAFWQHEAKGIHRLVSKYTQGDAVRKSGKTMSVCGYSMEKERPVYFRLNDLSEDEQTLAVIGSGSLQYLFKPSFVRGHHLLDGGIAPDICTNPAPADKIPLLPMLAEDVDLIIVNFLIASDSVNRAAVPKGVDYIELRPSVPLEAYPGAGTLDFSPEKLRSHESIGYADTLRLFKDSIL